LLGLPVGTIGDVNDDNNEDDDDKEVVEELTDSDDAVAAGCWFWTSGGWEL
jgi:hypothetical protein